MTIPDYTWLYMTIHAYTWLYITTCDYSWLYMAIYVTLSRPSWFGHRSSWDKCMSLFGQLSRPVTDWPSKLWLVWMNHPGSVTDSTSNPWRDGMLIKIIQVMVWMSNPWLGWDVRRPIRDSRVSRIGHPLRDRMGCFLKLSHPIQELHKLIQILFGATEK